MASPMAAVERVGFGLGRDEVGDRLGHLVGGRGLAQIVQHEGGRADGGGRIGPAGTGDVMRGAVHRLEQGRAGARRVEVGRGGVADPPGHRAGQIGDDVAEQVVGHDDVVAARVLHQVDAGGVDVVVVPGDRRVVDGHLVDRPLPEVAGEGEHVGLVHQGQMVPGPGGGQLEGEPGAALDAVAGVHRSLRGHLEGGPLAKETTLAGVGALGVLPDHHEVTVRGGRTGHPGEGPHVHVQVQVEAQLEQQAPLERPRGDGRGADRRAHGAEEDGVLSAQLGEHRVREHLAGAHVAVGAEVVLVGVEGHPGRADHLDRLGHHFGTDAVPPDQANPVRAHCPSALLFVFASFVVVRHRGVGSHRRATGHRPHPAPAPCGIEKPPTEWTVERHIPDRCVPSR